MVSGFDAEGEVARLVLQDAVEQCGGDRDVGGLDGPGHEPFGVMACDGDGLSPQARIAERRRKIVGRGGAEHLIGNSIVKVVGERRDVRNGSAIRKSRRCRQSMKATWTSSRASGP